ncbi:O-antigen ligase family protein [Pelagibius marinus]|uniref:O-antigen ligase family protein n=1 Tax=Pelagibius marinus TaxID=2762760 RepID=UPI00187269C6|nr:O-antigen ligase [Pelagibius marinus]
MTAHGVTGSLKREPQAPARLAQDDAGTTLERGADWPRAAERLFLIFVLTIASYALSLQPQVQTLAWYLAYLVALALFLLRYGAFLESAWIAVPLLIWPLAAGLSYTWSDAPGQSLRSAVQLTMTVLISFYLGARFSLADLARALFIVLAVTGLLSLAAILAKSGFAYDHNGIPRGIFPHKNVLGGRMVLLLLCCLMLFAEGWRRLTMILAAALGTFLIALSQSGTAIVMALGLCALAPLLLTRHAAAPLRLIAYLVALLSFACLAWVFLAFDLDPVALALQALGKEPTLTGRSELWAFAAELIEERPLLGGGYDAFWHGGVFSAGSYLQHVVQQEIMNFHNSYLDIAVQLGALGLAITLLFLLFFAWRALALLHRSSSAIAALPAFYLAFVTVYSLSEYALFRQHALIQILLGAFYVSAVLALPDPRRRQASPANWPET